MTDIPLEPLPPEPTPAQDEPPLDPVSPPDKGDDETPETDEQTRCGPGTA